MKKIITAAGAAAVCYKLSNIKAHAWVGVTHRDIMSKALDILKKENKIKIYSFFSDFTQELEDGCTAPDRGKDIDHGAGMHYYSCSKPRGKELSETNGYYKSRMGKFLPSARTLMEQNYLSAVSLYRSGKKSAAMTCFARAAHFVSDMGCTVHVSNIRCFDRRGNIHNAFEAHAKTNCKAYTAENLDKRLTKHYEKDSFQDAMNKLIKYSAQFVKQVRTLDPLRFNDIEQQTLVTTQQHVAALMIRFYNDCTRDTGNCLLENRNYIINNLFSGLNFTVTKKGIILAENDPQMDQRLRFEWNDKGYFKLVTTDKKYISKNFRTLYENGEDEKVAQFRAIQVGKDQFVITVGAKDFKKVLCCSSYGNLKITKFDPRKPSQIWKIK